MEEQNHENALQVAPLAINWTRSEVPSLIGHHHANEPYMITPGSNHFHQAPVQNQIIQWSHSQQTHQNYVQFLAESGFPHEILNETPCDFSVHIPSHGLLSSSQEQYVMPHGERNLLTNYSNMEHQFSFQKEDWNKACSNEFQTYNGSDVIASKCHSEDRKKKSREKAYAADRNRRFRISQWLDALQELLPHLKEASKEALLDNVIGHMKYLQYQVKDLCRSRLGGESTSNNFMYVEGHGHYLVNEQRLDKPLEEAFGKLLEASPSAVNELLHSKGLLMLPAASVEGLPEQTEILDMQGIMALDRILHEEFPSGMY